MSEDQPDTAKPIPPNIHAIRAAIAKDIEVVGYELGRAAADKAIDILKRGGVLKGYLEGQFPNEDVEFKKQLVEIAAANSIEPKVLYNPGSNRHVSLATAFPEARTIFADTDAEAMHEVAREGFETYQADMHSFTLPDGLLADMVLILNAGFMTEQELDHVTKPDALVIVNNWHGAHDFMQRQCPGYHLVGAEDDSGYTSDTNTVNTTRFTTNSDALFVYKRDGSVERPVGDQQTVQAPSNLPRQQNETGSLSVDLNAIRDHVRDTRK